MPTMRSQDPADAVADTDRLAALEATGLLDNDGAPSEGMDRLTRLATRLTGADMSAVTLVDRNRQCFAGLTGMTGRAADERQTDLEHSFCAFVVRDHDELIAPDTRVHPLLHDNPATPDIGAYAGVPLVTSEGTVLGSFCAFNAEPREWSADDVDALRELAAVCTREVELVTLSRRLSDTALCDELTGLPTRRLAVSKLRTAIARSRFDAGHAVVLYLDLDGFKAVNDDLGHAAGDRVLTMAAERLSAGVRAGDTVARCGGDEFMVVCEDVEDMETAQLIVDRVRDFLAEPLGVPGLEHGIRASIGVALGEHGEDPEHLIGRADEAMYEEKRVIRAHSG